MRFCNGAEAATSCITFAVAKAAPPWLLEATPQALRPSRMLEVLGVLVIASLRAQNISWSCALILFVLRRAIQTQACARGTRCTYFSRGAEIPKSVCASQEFCEAVRPVRFTLPPREASLRWTSRIAGGARWTDDWRASIHPPLALLIRRICPPCSPF